MGWARIDDGFHDHPKVIGVSLEAIGLWTKCLTWAHRHTTGTPGHIPADLPKTYAGARAKRLAGELVAHGLWDVRKFSDSFSENPDSFSEKGPNESQKTVGWVIHDYTDYLPASERPQTASEISKARSEAGRRGAEARWAKAPESQDDGNLPSDPMASTDGKPMPPTRPDPTSPEPTTKAELPTPPLREDVEAICTLLADRVEGNGVKRPKISDAWRTSARLLIDNDGYPMTEIVRVINWAQDDVGFWAANVQAMPTLRKKFGQLLVRSKAEAQGRASPPRQPTRHDDNAEAVHRMQLREQAMRNADQSTLQIGMSR